MKKYPACKELLKILMRSLSYKNYTEQKWKRLLDILLTDHWTLNSVARTLKKLRTIKGDYWTKQWFSSIAPLFKMEFYLMERIRSQKVTHITGRLLDQAVNLFNYAPFQNGTQLVAKQRIKLHVYLPLVGEIYSFKIFTCLAFGYFVCPLSMHIV